MNVSVAGGFYGERCVWPGVDDAFGSGGRAASALANAGAHVRWHYYAPEANWERARLLLGHELIDHRPSPSRQQVNFRYVHPLSTPTFSPKAIPQELPLDVNDALVLRFGFMEGTSRVSARRCVYDPQSPHEPEPFARNGSTANELAIVLNNCEVLSYGQADSEEDAVRNLSSRDRSNIVLVKAGADGCRVYADAKHVGTVPPYWSENVYKIGSGDVFSAAFTYHWGMQGREPSEAADCASRCVASFCESRTPNVEITQAEEARVAVEQTREGRVYIAGPFFTMSELWLIEEAYSALTELGVHPFSPYHHVGFGDPETVVTKDLAGLDACDTVFALLDGCDPGTLFEIGYAARRGIPVIALSQNPKEADLTMLLGTKKCHITNDFATGIYHATWRARR